MNIKDIFSKRYNIYFNFRKYIPCFKKYIVLLFVIKIIKAVIELLPPLLFSALLQKVMIEKNIKLLPWIVLGYLILFIIKTAFDGLSLKFSNKTTYKFSFALRKNIMRKLLFMDYSQFKRYSVGDLKLMIDDDVDKINDFISEQLVNFFYLIFNTLIIMTILFYLNIKMSLIFMLSSIVLFYFDIVLSRKMRSINVKFRALNGNFSSWISNSLQMWNEIKNFVMEKNQNKIFMDFTNKHVKLSMEWLFFWQLGISYNDLKNIVFSRMMIYIVGSIFIINGDLNIGALILFIQYFTMFFSVFNDTIKLEVKLNANKVFYEKVLSILEVKVNKNRINKYTHGDIELKNVEFKYNNSNKNVLNNISFKIGKNEKIAIIGESGCGKSTLAQLILNLYKPTKGKIFYNGLISDEISERDFYNNISAVMQHNFLFNMSIIDNFYLVNRKATTNEIRTVCDQVGILEFIESLPKKFDTVIGERGIKLSGGQKQRLGIAQALMKKSQVLILDEVTSALDFLNESNINNIIESASKTKTVIIITHRKSSILLADRVYVMNEGQIVSSGVHEELIDSCKYYQELFMNELISINK